MAEKLGKWASNRGLISKIRPSDGCKGDTVPSTVVRGYDLRKPGGHLGNVGLDQAARSVTHAELVIAGLDPAIQSVDQPVKDWMPGSGPGMTWVGVCAIWY